MTTPPTAPPTWATEWDQATEDAEWDTRSTEWTAKPTSKGGPDTVVDPTAGDQTFVDWLSDEWTWDVRNVSKVNETVGWDGPDYTYLLKEAA